MDGTLKELTKLENLTSKSSAIADSLDSLIWSLNEVKTAYSCGTVDEDTLKQLVNAVESHKKEVDDRQKEAYASLSRLGKALDRQFPTPLPTYLPLFASESSKSALERTIAIHFLRTGQFNIADTFLEESKADISPDLRTHFVELHRILEALRNGDIGPALEWTVRNRESLESRSSPLEFQLHRSQYLRLLLQSESHNEALSYAKRLQPFFLKYRAEFQRLICCVLYHRLSRLDSSPYADLASPSVHTDLEPLFEKEYCASLGLSRQPPLRVVSDIGGGGALARIEKGRKVMRERKSEWSQTNELPIEIPLPPENRYHSIFACPVSKEQSTEQNPPMMMSCGHVITKESLHRLSKPGGRVKCPYCPTESQLSAALRVFF